METAETLHGKKCVLHSDAPCTPSRTAGWGYFLGDETIGWTQLACIFGEAMREAAALNAGDGAAGVTCCVCLHACPLNPAPSANLYHLHAHAGLPL